jgi:acyl dehydratase
MVKRPCIENRTFDEISIGDEASLSRTLAWRDIELFAAMSGDVNPAHVDAEFAKNDMFHRIIAHGMWGGALISTVLGTELPGPGTIYLSQSLEFRHPIGLGDTVIVKIRAVAKNAAKSRVSFDCTVTNQAGQTVIGGVAEVIAPTEKICRERAELPHVQVCDAER